MRVEEIEMKSFVCMLAVAGLAGSVSAQDYSLSIASGPTSVDTTGSSITITIDIVGDASVGTHMLGGSFSLETSSSGSVIDMTWIPAAWSSFNDDGGYAGNGDYNPVIFGQIVIPGIPPFDVPAAGSELGNVIGSFQIVIAADTWFTMDMYLVAQDPFSLEVYDILTGEAFHNSDGNLTLNGASISVVPSPSSLALIGLGGLVGTRRRR